MKKQIEVPAGKEDAAVEAGAAISLRDWLKREEVENATGRPKDIALELWGEEIHAEILAGLKKQP